MPFCFSAVRMDSATVLPKFWEMAPRSSFGFFKSTVFKADRNTSEAFTFSVRAETLRLGSLPSSLV